MGLRHGSYCVGCCWFLMALLFVGGVMNLAWIAGIALYVAAEKLLPWRRVATAGVSVVLVVVATGVAVAPASVPWLTVVDPAGRVVFINDAAKGLSSEVVRATEPGARNGKRGMRSSKAPLRQGEHAVQNLFACAHLICPIPHTFSDSAPKSIVLVWFPRVEATFHRARP